VTRLRCKFNTGAEERTGEIELEAGKAYDLEVRFSNFKEISSMSPYVSLSGLEEPVT
jgi:beta-glucosidase